MIYGLTGASGTGKTTLARLIESGMDITFVPTSITEAARKVGYNAIGNLTLPERIDLQEKLLEDHIEVLKQAPVPVIYDRTPIDMASYMMCEVYMNSEKDMTEDEISRAKVFVDKCVETTIMFYDMIFLIAPLDFYTISATRPGKNDAYQTHFDLVMRGIYSKMEGRINMQYVNTPDLDQRHDCVDSAIEDRINALEQARKSNKNIH